MTSLPDQLREPRTRPDPPPGPYLVAGMGKAGMAAAAALGRLEGPARVKAWDQFATPPTEQARSKLSAAGIGCELGGDGVGLLDRNPRPACVVKSPGIPCDAPLLLEAARRGAAVIDELELGWRLARAPLVAVTGTNGKSTTASLLLAALQGASTDVALAGNTEFGPPLSAAPAAAPCIVCEASSFQLEGCPALLPEAAVFTNLTRDHLHRHGTMQTYGDVKGRLFVRGGETVRLAVVNIDSGFGRDLADRVEKAGGRAVRYGSAREADYRLESCDWGLRSLSARIRTPDGPLTAMTRHAGAHNAANVTAALAFADAVGLDPEATLERLAVTPPVPGRFEPIEIGQPFDVVVDFAHSPDALGSVIRAARRIVSARPGGRLIVVIASPGTHDPPKRPQMGRIARRLADELLITTTSTYGEDPAVPLEGLLHGASDVEGATFEVEIDRRAAIERALRRARAGDLVLVAGRGALPTLRLDKSGAGHPFDDREVVRDLLAELNESRRAAGAARGSSGRALQPQ